MYPKLKKSFWTKNCLCEGNIFLPTSCESEHEPSKSSFPVSDRDLRRETRFGRSGTRREISGRALLLPFRFSPVFFRFFHSKGWNWLLSSNVLQLSEQICQFLLLLLFFSFGNVATVVAFRLFGGRKKPDKYFVAGENLREASPEKFRKKSGMKVGRRRRSWLNFKRAGEPTFLFLSQCLSRTIQMGSEFPVYLRKRYALPYWYPVL